MTAPELADCYVPVPLRWRHVRRHDVVVGKSGDLLQVQGVGNRDGQPVVKLYSHDEWFTADPDEVATVLMLATERDALTTVRDILGGQLTERRTAA